jgi:hypothetical protein
VARLRVGGSIGQVDVSVLIPGQVDISALIPGRDGISAAFIFVGRVEVFGLSFPVFVVRFVCFMLFVVVGQAAASESEHSSVVVTWVGISSPFRFRVIGDTTSRVGARVGMGDATIPAAPSRGV